MEAVELLDIIKRGEHSCCQFKETINNAVSIAAEMVAFLNSQGGKLIIGVSDKGDIIGLSKEDVSRINQIISNAASQHVRNAINPITDNILVGDKIVMVVNIPEGMTKPYMDSQGLIWVRSGSDKRKVTAHEEMRRIFQESDLIHADEIPVEGTTIGDIDLDYFKNYFQQVYLKSFDDSSLSIVQALKNMGLSKNDKLNLSGLLLFSKNPQRYKPVFLVKAVSFYGNSATTTQYRDKEDIDGNLRVMYEKSDNFLVRNLHKVQVGQEFNSEGQLEIPHNSLKELLVNMLIHRNYFISSPCKLFIFDNRIELISPGHLPNSLTVENIKMGTSVMRNPILTSFALKVLPFSGLGTGIMRALDHYPHIDFVNDVDNNLFRCIIHRPAQP